MTVRHAVTKIFVNTGKHIARHGQTLAQNLGEKFNRGVAATQTMVAGLGTRSEETRDLDLFVSESHKLKCEQHYDVVLFGFFRYCSWSL